MPERRVTNYEERLRQEYALYSAELDLWNNTKLGELERETQARILMERLDDKN